MQKMILEFDLKKFDDYFGNTAKCKRVIFIHTGSRQSIKLSTAAAILVMCEKDEKVLIKNY